MNHFHEEKNSKAFLFFLRIMKCFLALIIITTSINTTLLPSVMSFNVTCFSSVTSVRVSNLGSLFLEFLIQNF